MVASKYFPRLLEILKKDSLSKTIHMLGLIHNISKGSVKAKLYTDSWPHFSALVCELRTPENNGLFCYSKNNQALCDVIATNNLITEDRSQLLYVGDDTESKSLHVVQTVMDTLQLKKSVRTYKQFHIPISATNKERMSHLSRCPPGYRVEKLQSRHSDLVHAKWGVSGTSSKWIQQCIENLNSAALYREDDLANPVAWILEYQTREIGCAYTSEFYRNNGYAVLVGAVLCKTLVKDWPGIPLFATVEKDTSITGLGLVHSGFIACCV